MKKKREKNKAIIDLIVNYYFLKHEHYNLYSRNINDYCESNNETNTSSKSIISEKLLSDYLELIDDNTMNDSITEQFYKRIVDKRKNNVLTGWSVSTPTPTTFIDKIRLLNEELYERSSHNRSNRKRDYFMLRILYYEYFKFIFGNAKLREQYLADCEQYSTKTEHHDDPDESCLSITSISRTKRSYLKDFFNYVKFKNSKSKKKSKKKSNNKSMILNSNMLPFFIILFNMIDDRKIKSDDEKTEDKNFLDIIKKNEWMLLKPYELELFLFISFYCLKNKQYVRLVKKVSESLKVRAKKIFEIVLEFIESSNLTLQNQLLAKLINDLITFENKNLKFNSYYELLLENILKEIEEKKKKAAHSEPL